MELSPSHTPHSSKVEAPFGTPAQSAHDELSPSHTPHSSSTASPLTTPLQSVCSGFIIAVSHERKNILNINIKYLKHQYDLMSIIISTIRTISIIFTKLSLFKSPDHERYVFDGILSG